MNDYIKQEAESFDRAIIISNQSWEYEHAKRRRLSQPLLPPPSAVGAPPVLSSSSSYSSSLVSRPIPQHVKVENKSSHITVQPQSLSSRLQSNHNNNSPSIAAASSSSSSHNNGSAFNEPRANFLIRTIDRWLTVALHSQGMMEDGFSFSTLASLRAGLNNAYLTNGRDTQLLDFAMIHISQEYPQWSHLLSPPSSFPAAAALSLSLPSSLQSNHNNNNNNPSSSSSIKKEANVKHEHDTIDLTISATPSSQSHSSLPLLKSPRPASSSSVAASRSVTPTIIPESPPPPSSSSSLQSSISALSLSSIA